MLQSCDCIQHVSGTIVNKETNQPISNVKVTKLRNKKVTTLTNEKGEFKLESISGGLFRCPPMILIIEIEGYEKIEYKGGGKIELKKLK